MLFIDYWRAQIAATGIPWAGLLWQVTDVHHCHGWDGCTDGNCVAVLSLAAVGAPLHLGPLHVGPEVDVPSLAATLPQLALAGAR